MANDPFFKDSNYIDVDAVEQMFLKLDYKLDKIIKMLNASNSSNTGEKKLSTEIPAQAKEQMKEVLNNEVHLLNTWETELFKDLSNYPRWSEKQQGIYEKIINEFPERRQQYKKLEETL